jgi:hypothetical protein
VLYWLCGRFGAGSGGPRREELLDMDPPMPKVSAVRAALTTSLKRSEEGGGVPYLLSLESVSNEFVISILSRVGFGRKPQGPIVVILVEVCGDL